MKLLFATYRDKWEKDILRNFYYLIHILKNIYGYLLIDLSDYSLGTNFETILEKYHNVESILVIENHNNILINNIFNNFFNNNIKKYIYADDIHKSKDLKEKDYYENFNKIFITYYTPFLQMYPNIDKSKIIWCPHGFTEDYLLKFNDNPINKILLSGAMGLLYPVRKQMFKLSKNEYKDKINYIKHPGYKQFEYLEINDNNSIKIGKSYAKTLNNHICCFTDCLTYGFIVSKYFEIPATGSLLLAVNPNGDKLENLGFKNDINYIECNRDNLEEKINWILDPENRNKVDQIRKNGMDLVRTLHSINDRAKTINENIYKN